MIEYHQPWKKKAYSIFTMPLLLERLFCDKFNFEETVLSLWAY